MHGRTAALLLACVGAACGTIPLPPPSIMPTDHRPLSAGGWEAGLGSSVVAGEKGIERNGFGSPWGMAHLRWAPAERWELGLRAGPGLADLHDPSPWPLAGIQAGYAAIAGEAWTGWTRVGLGGAWLAIDTAPCADGTQACPGGWLSLSPNLQLALERRLGARWRVAASLRASYGFTTLLRSLPAEWKSHAWWLEANAGPAVRLGERWHLGVSAGLWLVHLGGGQDWELGDTAVVAASLAYEL